MSEYFNPFITDGKHLGRIWWTCVDSHKYFWLWWWRNYWSFSIVIPTYPVSVLNNKRHSDKPREKWRQRDSLCNFFYISSSFLLNYQHLYSVHFPSSVWGLQFKHFKCWLRFFLIPCKYWPRYFFCSLLVWQCNLRPFTSGPVTTVRCVVGEEGSPEPWCSSSNKIDLVIFGVRYNDDVSQSEGRQSGDLPDLKIYKSWVRYLRVVEGHICWHGAPGAHWSRCITNAFNYC